MVQYARQALALLDGLGKDAPGTAVFRAKRILADTLSATLNQNLDEAHRLFAEAIQLAQRDSSISKTDFAILKANQGGMFLNDGKNAEAEAALRESIEIFRQENIQGAWTAMPYYELAIMKSRSGDFAAAKGYAHDFYEVRLKNLGPNHSATAQAKLMWARFLAETGEVDEAAKLALEAMAVARIGPPPLSSNLWTALTCVSHVLNMAGRFAEAEPYAREEIATCDCGFRRCEWTVPTRCEYGRSAATLVFA